MEEKKKKYKLHTIKNFPTENQFLNIKRKAKLKKVFGDKKDDETKN